MIVSLDSGLLEQMGLDEWVWGFGKKVRASVYCCCFCCCCY